MTLSQEGLRSRYAYLKICLNELEDWLDLDPEQTQPQGYTRVVERLYQIIVDELVAICRWYLSDETDLSPSERFARQAVEIVGREAWIERDSLARFLGVYLNRRNWLVHSPETQPIGGLEEEAAALVQDAQRFYRGILLGFCPACDARMRFQRAPAMGSLGRCPGCGNFYQVDHIEPIGLIPGEPGDVTSPTALSAEPAAAAHLENAPAARPVPDPTRDLPGEPPVQTGSNSAEPAPEGISTETAGEPPAPELSQEAATRPEEPAPQPSVQTPSDVLAPEPEAAAPVEPATRVELAAPAWQAPYLEALQLHKTALQTGKGYGEALALFQKAVELGAAPAYRNLGVMYRLGQGCKPDPEQAVKQFNKGIKNNDGRCHAELALLFAAQKDRTRAQGKWKEYFNSQAFIRDQTFFEPELDRAHFAAQYLLYALEDDGEIQFWEKAAPYWTTAAVRLQSLIDEDRKARDKDRFARIVRRGAQITRLKSLAEIA